MTDAVSCARLFLLAENRLLREALKRILAKKSDLDIVGTASLTPSTMDVIVNASPNLLLFDPPDLRSGLAFLRLLRETIPSARVIMMGMETRSELLVQAVQEGITGYLLLDASAPEIVAAVRHVLNGGAVCPPELCHALFAYVAAQRPSLPSFEVQDQLGLTRREQQLVQMVGRGRTNKEIAAELNLSEQTVKNHIHRMLRKVGVRNRLQAAETFRMRGYLPM
jgi:two-component system NarL family response regulator